MPVDGLLTCSDFGPVTVDDTRIRPLSNKKRMRIYVTTRLVFMSQVRSQFSFYILVTLNFIDRFLANDHVVG